MYHLLLPTHPLFVTYQRDLYLECAGRAVIDKIVRTTHSACRAWKPASHFSATPSTPHCRSCQAIGRFRSC